MLDRDGRSFAAHALRLLATMDTDYDTDVLEEHADALEAEPEGYDYEWAAAERGEALRMLIDADVCDIPAHIAWSGPLSAAITRAEEIMEGVKPKRTQVGGVVDLESGPMLFVDGDQAEEYAKLQGAAYWTEGFNVLDQQEAAALIESDRAGDAAPGPA